MPDILTRLYDAWNKHDIKGVQSFFAPGSTYHDQAINATFNGPEELGQFMTSTFVAFPDLSFELVTTMETDMRFAGEALMKGTWKQDLGPMKATGRPFVIHYAIIGEKHDDQITKIVDYWNLGEITAE